MKTGIQVYGAIHPKGYVKPVRKPNKERQQGFYWVKDDGQWFVALYDGSWWQFPGSEFDYWDDEFEEIIETMLPEPNRTINV